MHLTLTILALTLSNNFQHNKIMKVVIIYELSYDSIIEDNQQSLHKCTYALNGFGVQLLETILTTKWFWLEIWGGRNNKK
jgi:hypothetical protein